MARTGTIARKGVSRRNFMIGGGACALAATGTALASTDDPVALAAQYWALRAAIDANPAWPNIPDHLRAEMARLESAIAAAPATTIAGVAAKLRIPLDEYTHNIWRPEELDNDDWLQMAALADACRLGGYDV